MENKEPMLSPEQQIKGLQQALDLLDKTPLVGGEVGGFNLARAAIVDMLNNLTRIRAVPPAEAPPAGPANRKA